MVYHYSDFQGPGTIFGEEEKLVRFLWSFAARKKKEKSVRSARKYCENLKRYEKHYRKWNTVFKQRKPKTRKKENGREETKCTSAAVVCECNDVNYIPTRHFSSMWRQVCMVGSVWFWWRTGEDLWAGWRCVDLYANSFGLYRRASRTVCLGRKRTTFLVWGDPYGCHVWTSQHQYYWAENY